MSIKKEIHLFGRRMLDLEPEHAFEVNKIINSTEYRIGQNMSKEQVDNLIENGFKVVIQKRR